MLVGTRVFLSIFSRVLVPACSAHSSACPSMWPSNPACSAWRKRASRVARAKPPGSCCACGGATCPFDPLPCNAGKSMLSRYRFRRHWRRCCSSASVVVFGPFGSLLHLWFLQVLVWDPGACHGMFSMDSRRCWPSGPGFFFLLAANPPTTSRNPALVRHSLSSPLTETLLSPHPTIGRHLVFPLSTPRLSTAPRVVPVTRPLGAVYGDPTSGGSRLLTRATATGYKKAAVSQ